jgi:hypothetical protein
LAFADFDFQSIGCFADLVGWYAKGFGDPQGSGAEDTVFVSRLKQSFFQFLFLFLGKVWRFY